MINNGLTAVISEIVNTHLNSFKYKSHNLVIIITIDKIVGLTQKGGKKMNGKRKLVVPLVAIMMCAVALAGVAYAYQSSVNVNNNTTPASDFVLEVYDKNAVLISEPIAVDKLIVLQHATTVVSGAGDTVVVSAAAGTEYVGKIMINDEVGANYTVSATIPSGATKTISGISGGTGTIEYTLDVDLFVDNGAGAPGDAYTGANLNGDTTLWYKVTVTISAAAGESGNAISFTNATAQTDVDAVDTAVLAQTFNLSFSAASV